MAYDEAFAERVRDLTEGDRNVTEKKILTPALAAFAG